MSAAARIFVLSVVALGALWISERDAKPVVHPPGLLVREPPRQIEVEPTSFMLDEYELTRRARFEIRARVLSVERYYLHREADLSPLDLALGWGVMSDQAVLDRIEISQGNRWYFTRYDLPAPVPEQQIVHSSGNMHMIPARPELHRSLKRLRRGDIITLKGFLVDVNHPSGWYWRTSMSRTDSGNGACELVYVESLDVETAG